MTPVSVFLFVFFVDVALLFEVTECTSTESFVSCDFLCFELTALLLGRWDLDDLTFLTSFCVPIPLNHLCLKDSSALILSSGLNWSNFRTNFTTV